MIKIERGFGANDGVWVFNFHTPFEIVAITKNKPDDYFLNQRIEKYKERNITKDLNFVGAGFVMATNRYYDNIKEITREKILVKEYEHRLPNGETEILYNKEFDVHVIWFNKVYNWGDLIVK